MFLMIEAGNMFVSFVATVLVIVLVSLGAR